MTPEQRRDLLERLVKCAPKSMKATLAKNGDGDILFVDLWDCKDWTRISDKHVVLWLSEGYHDSINAQARDFLLDEMEEAGYQWSLSRYDDPADPGKYHMSIGPLNDSWGWERQSVKGETRTEAVVRAFLSCFEKVEA